MKAIGGGGKPGSTWSSFAANCLLARRLVERGVRFVNIIHASWDHHTNLDTELALQRRHGRPADRRADQGPEAARPASTKRWSSGAASSAARRWARTARGFAEVTGRDHHPFAFSILMAGGGIKGGQVYGETDEIGWNIVERPGPHQRLPRHACCTCSASTT